MAVDELSVKAEVIGNDKRIKSTLIISKEGLCFNGVPRIFSWATAEISKGTHESKTLFFKTVKPVITISSSTMSKDFILDDESASLVLSKIETFRKQIIEERKRKEEEERKRKEEEERKRKAEEARKSQTYAIADKQMRSAVTDEQYNTAAKIFLGISDYRDSAEKAKKCEQAAKDYRAKKTLELYNSACKAMSTAITISDYKRVQSMFNSIIDYSDSRKKSQECNSIITKLEEELKAELERKAAEERIARVQKLIDEGKALVLSNNIGKAPDSNIKKAWSYILDNPYRILGVSVSTSLDEANTTLDKIKKLAIQSGALKQPHSKNKKKKKHK